MITQTNIGVKLTVEGFHRFPSAAEIFGVSVKFLEDRHRHNFGILAKMKVAHDNRDKEFILLKREIEAHIKSRFGKPAEFGAMSCEAVCRHIFETFDLEYVRVDEDGENFAEIFKLIQ